jgi:chromosome segregation ATPase
VSAGNAKETKLQAAIESLKSELVSETLAASSAKTESEKAISALKAKFSDQAALRKVEVDAYAKATANLGSQIQALESSLAQAQEREKRMQDSMAALSGGKGEVKSQMLALQRELDEAQSAAATATAKAKEVQSKYARDRLQLEAEVEGLKADVADYAVGKAEAETAAAKASAETSALRASSRSQRLGLVAKETELKEQLEQARMEAATVRFELTQRQREASEALAGSFRKGNWLGGLFQSKQTKKRQQQLFAPAAASNTRHTPKRERRALTKPKQSSRSLTWRLPRFLRLSILFIFAAAATHFTMGLVFLF